MGWIVGENGGDYLGAKTAWSAQAQVLVANVLANVARLTLTELNAIKATLTGVGVMLAKNTRWHTTSLAVCWVLALRGCIL